MKRLAIGLLSALGGYVVAALVGFFLIDWSSNTHDRSVEAAMTSAFVLGPLGAVVAFVAGVLLGGRASAGGSPKAQSRAAPVAGVRPSATAPLEIGRPS